MDKMLLCLAARGGVESWFRSRLEEEATHLHKRSGVSGLRVTALQHVDDDPFHPESARLRAFEGSLEVLSPGALELDVWVSVVEGLAQRLEEVVHLDLSCALVGIHREVVRCDLVPVRYQYLMRRRADFSHAQYLDRCWTIHSEFGRRTPGIRGYAQLHVDPAAARAVAAAAGFGISGADSVSELYLESIETFMAALENQSVGGEAQEDEEKFVDRANSLQFTSDVVLRLGFEDAA